jgi:putative Mg2+ transporter-C (MgtC) family protein
MTADTTQIALELGAAWLAGGLIGAERTYHGRAAGFRTHALVAIAAAAAVMVHKAPGFTPGLFVSDAALDPTRLAQGVMTGVGFLGAGVIFKEGVNVQGLTTAASVWATAALGLLFGLGEYSVGALATGGVLATLVGLRWIENLIPARIYAWATLRFRATAAPDKAALEAMLDKFGVTLRDVSYALTHDGAVMEFSGNVVARTERCFDDLSDHLRGLEGIAEYQLSRISK